MTDPTPTLRELLAQPFEAEPKLASALPPDRTADGKEAPLAGQVLMRLVQFDSDYNDDGADGRVITTIDDANVITSMIRGTSDPNEGVEPEHRVVLDIDWPVKAVPSSTPGHYHLYIDCPPISTDRYLAVIEAMAVAGIVEEGYYLAADRRRHTAVRLPWVKKEGS